MKRIISNISLFFLVLFIPVSLLAADFSKLTERRYNFEGIDSANIKPDEEVHFFVEERRFTPIEKKLADLDALHPLRVPQEENNAADILLGIVDVSGKGDRYYLVLTWGPSYDIGYVFYNEIKANAYVPGEDEYLESNFTVPGTSLIVPGDGYVYSYGHNDNLHSLKRKYLVENGNFVEINQDFYFIGEVSKALKEITAFSDLTFQEPIFSLRTGETVQVVGLKREKADSFTPDVYVIASEFGFIGYVKAELKQEATQFTGFYWSGD